MYGLGGQRGIVKTRALSFGLYLVFLLVGIVVLPLVLAGPGLVDRVIPRAVLCCDVALLADRAHRLGLRAGHPVSPGRAGADPATGEPAGRAADHADLAHRQLPAPRLPRRVGRQYVDLRATRGPDRPADLALRHIARRPRRRRLQRRRRRGVAAAVRHPSQDASTRPIPTSPPSWPAAQRLPDSATSSETATRRTASHPTIPTRATASRATVHRTRTHRTRTHRTRTHGTRVRSTPVRAWSISRHPYLVRRLPRSNASEPASRTAEPTTRGPMLGKVELTVTTRLPAPAPRPRKTQTRPAQILTTGPKWTAWPDPRRRPTTIWTRFS